MLDHVRRFHGGGVVPPSSLRAFVAGGTKQLKLVKALFDLDRCRGEVRGCYLQRSAALLRKWVHPPLPKLSNILDDGIAFFLGGAGPKYINAEAAARGAGIRRVGHTYYDDAFAEWFLQSAIVAFGRMLPTRRSLMQQYLNDGYEAALLLPVNARGWLELLEDVLSCPAVTALETSLVRECVDHNEFRVISMDCTLRVVMQIKGQANYRDPKERGVWCWDLVPVEFRRVSALFGTCRFRVYRRDSENVTSTSIGAFR